MKLLWLSNIPTPDITEALNSGSPHVGGWVASLYNRILVDESIDMDYWFPYQKNRSVAGHARSNFHGFALLGGKQTRYDKRLEHLFYHHLKKTSPDIIHIFGSEFPHTLAMVNAAKRAGLENRIIIAIQGLISKCAYHYTEGLPESIINRWTFRDLIRWDNIRCQQNTFKKRGAFEIKAIQNVTHIAGRTTWDKACTTAINPDIVYHHVDETLRDGFNHSHWELEKCKRHTILTSSAEYPIKGAHYMLKAMPEIIRHYPDARLVITGNKQDDITSLRAKLRITAYQRYLLDLIKCLGLEAFVTFTGPLNEAQMIRAYQDTHVFVCPSVIENSPNAVCEAMLLGVPIVSANVGGVSDLMTHGQDGYLYHSAAPYMLAHYVMSLFSDDKTAKAFSAHARVRAVKRHDAESNAIAVLDLYEQIIDSQK